MAQRRNFDTFGKFTVKNVFEILVPIIFIVDHQCQPQNKQIEFSEIFYASIFAKYHSDVVGLVQFLYY